MIISNARMIPTDCAALLLNTGSGRFVRQASSQSTGDPANVREDETMTEASDDEQPATDGAKQLRFLTVAQVADELATKQSLVRALIKTGDLPAIQVGGRGV
jgi:excisionase family DNA binding protein